MFSTRALRPTLPKLPKPKAPKAFHAAKPPTPPKPGAKGKSGKVGGLATALKIHQQVADAAINAPNIVAPGGALIAGVIERKTGLNNVSQIAGGGQPKHKFLN